MMIGQVYRRILEEQRIEYFKNQRKKQMNDLVLNVDGVEFRVNSNDSRVMFDVLRKAGLISNIAESHYFSRSKNQWYNISDMALPFLVNAVVARMRDCIDETKHLVDQDDTVDFVFLMREFTVLLNQYYDSGNDNLRQLCDVVDGLLRELEKRQQGNSLIPSVPPTPTSPHSVFSMNF